MACAPIKKDPDAFLDYTVNWASWLGVDVIVSVAWTIPSPLLGSQYSFGGTYATVWLAGGVAGEVYSVVCEITTAAGRIEDRTLYIQCEER